MKWQDVSIEMRIKRDYEYNIAYKLNTFVLHRKEPIHIVTTKEKFFWNSQLEIHSIAILAWSISLGLLICTPTTDLRNRETLEKFQVLETLDKIWIKGYGWALRAENPSNLFFLTYEMKLPFI